MYCNDCGTNAGDSKICPNCGAKILQETVTSQPGGQMSSQPVQFQYPKMNFKLANKFAFIPAALLLLSTFLGNFCSSILGEAKMFTFGALAGEVHGILGGDSNIFIFLMSAIGWLTIINAGILVVHAFKTVNLIRIIGLSLECLSLVFCLVTIIDKEGLDGSVGFGFLLAVLGVLSGFAVNRFSPEHHSLRAGTWQCSACGNINPDSMVKCSCGMTKQQSDASKLFG